MAPESPSHRESFPGGTVLVWPRREPAEHAAANTISVAIHARVSTQGRAILGLATGSTPIPVYARLVDMVSNGSLSFDRVMTFNLDEYYPISGLDPQSYRFFMDQHLFRRVGIAPNQAHLLDGTGPESATAEHAAQFDHWVAEVGGLDLQLLGLGRNGHIGVNEPSHQAVAEALASPTRLVDLHPTTRADAARDFGGLDAVPRRALTMGLQSILASRSILVLAFGVAKAAAVERSLRGPMTAEVPGSLLQAVHDRVTWFLDADAASLVC